MTDDTTSVPATPLTPAQPVYPPVDATKGVPPITPFPAWTWTTPVIPQFYWNVYSAEQRIRQICTEIGKIQAYLEYFAANSNAAHWYLDQRFTETETRLTARIDRLETQLTEEVTRLDKLIADETTNRVNADNALQAQVNANKTGIETNSAAIAKETQDRTDADTALGRRIDAEATARQDGDDDLNARVDDETTARKTADTALGQRIDTETTARTDGDNALRDSIDAETAARDQAVQNEATARIAGDKTNADAIAAETKARTTADNDITVALNHRPRANAITAKEGSHITVTATEGDGTDANQATVVIGDTFDADFKTLTDGLAKETSDRTTADAALREAIDAEVDERRHDDEVQNEQIAGKLAFGSVKAGAGVTVTNDPDSTTVTVAAEVTQDKLNTAVANLQTQVTALKNAGYITGVVTRGGLLSGQGTRADALSLQRDSFAPTRYVQDVTVPIYWQASDSTVVPDLQLFYGDGLITAQETPESGDYYNKLSVCIQKSTGLFFNNGALAITGVRQIAAGHNTPLYYAPGIGDAQAIVGPLIASYEQPGVVRPNELFNVSDAGTLSLRTARGLTATQDSMLEAHLGAGLSFADNGAITAAVQGMTTVTVELAASQTFAPGAYTTVEVDGADAGHIVEPHFTSNMALVIASAYSAGGHRYFVVYNTAEAQQTGGTIEYTSIS